MREITDLESNAMKFWPSELAEREKSSSIIPKLIDTQDNFISLLTISDASPFAWKNTLLSTRVLFDNLFLKHLVVLSDIGGEKLMRFKKELPRLFTDNIMVFFWKNNEYTYTFQTLQGEGNNRNWNNMNLFIDGDGLMGEVNLTPMMEDVCMLLMFGGFCTNVDLPDEITEKCIIGSMLGKPEELEKFVRQRYIFVSRITGGATANTLGQLSQNYVKEYLEAKLPDWRINKDQLPNVSQNDRTPLAIDIIVKSPTNKYYAVEVSFQVTTNSTIERKAGQAQSRYDLLHAQGHKIAYVIDGAGNFARNSALTTISQYSDMIVTFKDEELDKLIDFFISLEDTQ